MERPVVGGALVEKVYQAVENGNTLDSAIFPARAKHAFGKQTSTASYRWASSDGRGGDVFFFRMDHEWIPL